MIPPRLLPHRVTWQRPTAATDAYGNTTALSFDAPVEKKIAGRLQQDEGVQTEQTNGRDAVIASWKLITNELGISAVDRIVHDGVTYEVVGQPYKVAGIAANHHAQVRLRAVVTA